MRGQLQENPHPGAFRRCKRKNLDLLGCDRYSAHLLLTGTLFGFPTSNRPLSFISLSHSDNQSESATKIYNSFKADVGGDVLTLT